MVMKNKICIISDAIEEPFDEGVKIFVFNLIKELSRTNNIISISRKEVYDSDIRKINKKALPKNKFLFSTRLSKEIRRFKPDIILYIPIACATIYSFFRSVVLKYLSGKTRLVMVTLQPRKYNNIEKLILPFMAPDLILAQSEKTKNDLSELGCNVKKIFAGVDLDKFKPIKPEFKKELRKKYNLPLNKKIVLHVGHINRNRNIQIMNRIQHNLNTQTLIVGSTSTQQDSELAYELRKNGVVIIDKTIKNIEEIYQLSDCYVFPVFNDNACIELPLSVFEALACNINVVSSNYGDLKTLVREQNGIKYCENEKEIIDGIADAFEKNNNNNHGIVGSFSWTNIATAINKIIIDLIKNAN